MFQIRWLWRNMDSRFRWRYITALVLSVVTSCLLLVNPYLTKILFDDVIMVGNTEPLVGLLLLMLGMQAVRLTLRYIMIIMLEKGSQNVLYNLRARLFEVLQYKEMRFSTGTASAICDPSVRRCGLVPAFPGLFVLQRGGQCGDVHLHPGPVPVH